jgi:hypothetical protein
VQGQHARLRNLFIDFARDSGLNNYIWGITDIWLALQLSHLVENLRPTGKEFLLWAKHRRILHCPCLIYDICGAILVVGPENRKSTPQLSRRLVYTGVSNQTIKKSRKREILQQRQCFR